MKKEELIEDSPLYSIDQGTATSHTSHPTVGVFSTSLNILNSVLGAGIFSIANSFTFCGIIPSVCMLSFCGLMTYASTLLVIKMHGMTGCDSITDLCLRTCGKVGTWILTPSIVLFCYGSMIAYLIMSGEILQSWASLLGYDLYSFGKRAVLVLVYSLISPIAMTVPRHLTFLGYISFFCVICLFTYAIVMIYEGIAILPSQGIEPSVETATFNLGLFNALGIYALAFSLAGIIIPIIRHMPHDDHKRFQATSISFFISFFIVLVPGVIGYLIFGAGTKSFILSNFGDDDVIFIIVRVASFVVLAAGYPVLGLTVLGVFSRLIYKTENHYDLPWPKRIVCLICQNIFPLCIAIFLPNVRPAMAIGGAFGGGCSNLVFPPLMWVILSPKKWYSPTNLICIVFFIIGTVFSIIATVEAVLDAIDQFKNTSFF